MDIEVERDKGVTLTYVDGYVVNFDLVTLREDARARPVAGCGIGVRRSGRARTSPTPLRIEDARLHGVWGLAITWNDGHDTGIFPFELLRSWHEGGHASGTRR